MTCAETREYLFAFLDSELDAPLSIELQRHLEHCPECAREAEIERSIRQHLSAALADAASVPENLEERIGRVVAPKSPSSRWAPVLRPAALVAAAAAMFCVVAGVWLALRGGNDVRLADLLVADFQEFIEQGKPLQLASGDPQVVAGWVDDRLGLDISLPPADGDAVKLLGARKCKIAGAPAAIVAYELKGTPTTLVVVKDRRIKISGMKRVRHGRRSHWIGRKDGHTVVACRRSDAVYAAVSTLPGERLLPMVRRIATVGE